MLLFDLLPILSVRSATDLSLIDALFASVPEMYNAAQRKVIVEKLMAYIKEAATRQDFKLASAAITVLTSALTRIFCQRLAHFPFQVS